MLFAPPYTVSRKAPGLHRQWSTQATTRQPAFEPTPSAEALQKLDASLDAFVARQLPPLHQSASAPADADGEFEHLVGVLEGREEDGACGGVHQFVGGVLDAKIEACCLSELLS